MASSLHSTLFNHARPESRSPTQIGNNMLNNPVSALFNAWKVPRWRWALLVAGVSDVLGIAVVPLPPIQWLLDAMTALALLLVLGLRWPLIVALAIELVPALAVFPAWTLVVLAISANQDLGDAVDHTDS
jgi:hypothetical protein